VVVTKVAAGVVTIEDINCSPALALSLSVLMQICCGWFRGLVFEQKSDVFFYWSRIGCVRSLCFLLKNYDVSIIYFFCPYNFLCNVVFSDILSFPSLYLFKISFCTAVRDTSYNMSWRPILIQSLTAGGCSDFSYCAGNLEWEVISAVCLTNDLDHTGRLAGSFSSFHSRLVRASCIYWVNFTSLSY